MLTVNSIRKSDLALQAQETLNFFIKKNAVKHSLFVLCRLKEKNILSLYISIISLFTIKHILKLVSLQALNTFMALETL